MARTPDKKVPPKPAAKPARSTPVSVRPEGIGRNALVILVVIAVGAALHWMRGILTPLALAIFLAIMIDSFARRLEHHWPRLPDTLSLAVAIVLSLVIFGVTAVVVAGNAVSFGDRLDVYAARLNILIQQLGNIFTFAGVEAPASITELFRKLDPARALQELAKGLQGILSDALFVLIYLGFIVAARRGFKRKIVALFPHNAERDEAVAIFNRIRFGVERYLWVQTVTGLMIAGASWVVMALMGLDNALFWAFLIFLASYIPIIGGIVGVVLPVVFALVQYEWIGWAVVLLAALQTIQFVVGNIITPRMQGNSLNIDPVVVLLALALWGALWGLPGMFLSTPLAVMAMIILAEFEGSRWIAILMSENGDPQGLDENGRRRRDGSRFGKADRAT
ncbi:MAG: AI-2E family transporter [Caulobacter sp.]|nr:AI-2E family transporter [Caulobacter sp.]